jgi:hypothetical protein
MHIAFEPCREENVFLPVVGAEPQSLGRLARGLESVYYKQEVLGRSD